MKKVEVVAAIIIHDNQVLAVQRPNHKWEYISLKYEFPGGKIEHGESHQEALSRELKEELNLDARVGMHVITVRHEYPDFELTMHSYAVRVQSKSISLNEHVAQEWLDKNDIYSVDWAAADIPIVDRLNTIEWQTL